MERFGRLMWAALIPAASGARNKVFYVSHTHTCVFVMLQALQLQLGLVWLRECRGQEHFLWLGPAA